MLVIDPAALEGLKNVLNDALGVSYLFDAPADLIENLRRYIVLLESIPVD